MKRCALLLLTLTACQASMAHDAIDFGALTPPEGLAEGYTLDPRWRDHITLEEVAEDDTPAFISTTGRVVADEERTQRISAPVSGRVKNVLVRLGDKVRVGQPVVELTSSEVAQLQADVKKARHDLDVATKARTRAKRLRNDGAVSDREVLQAEADYAKAKADVEQGNDHLLMLGISPRDPAVRAALYARVAGTVVERNVHVGQEVRGDSAEPLITISNLNRLWIVADVYERDLAHVQVGAQVRIEVPAYPGRRFTGEVAYVGDMVDATSRTVKVRCVVQNGDRKLKPEMFAKVEIDERRNDKALYIPTQALVKDGPRTSVLAVNEDTVRIQQVRVGPARQGRQQVLEGLAAKDVVVTDGALFLRHALQE